MVHIKAIDIHNGIEEGIKEVYGIDKEHDNSQTKIIEYEIGQSKENDFTNGTAKVVGKT